MEIKDFTIPYTGKGKSCYGKITMCAIFTDEYGNRELHALVVDEMGTGIIHMDTIYSYDTRSTFDKHIG